jgi:hypothetical protein
MKTIGVWVLGLALAAPVYAQDEAGENPDYQEGNSFSDYQEGDSPADDAAAMGAADVEDQAADAVDAGTDDTMAAGSDSADANSLSDDNDANSFSSDTDDANSFSSDTSDANSFSDTSDANSFSSDESSDANSFSDDGGYSGETASEDSGYGSGTSEEEEPRSPIPLYIGADYAWTTASFSNDSLKTAFGSDQVDSSMIRVRGGVRMFKKIGLEVQYGFEGQSADETAKEYSTSNFYGVYLVPTGVLLDFLEVGASIGYASTKLERGSASETLSGASFGVNFELPVLTTESFDIRIGGGGTVYRAQPSARIYGYHAGVRIDFRV